MVTYFERNFENLTDWTLFTEGTIPPGGYTSAQNNLYVYSASLSGAGTKSIRGLNGNGYSNTMQMLVTNNVFNAGQYNTVAYLRMYMGFDVLPASGYRISPFAWAPYSVEGLWVDSAGRVGCSYAFTGNAYYFSGASVIQAGVPYRVEMMVSPLGFSGGGGEVRLYKGANVNGTVPDHVQLNTTHNGWYSSEAYIYWGFCLDDAGVIMTPTIVGRSLTLDDIIIKDSWPGPAGEPAPPASKKGWGIVKG